MLYALIGAVIGLVIGGVIAWIVSAKLAVQKKVQQDESTIGTAEKRAQEIIDEAGKEAEAKKREASVDQGRVHPCQEGT